MLNDNEVEFLKKLKEDLQEKKNILAENLELSPRLRELREQLDEIDSEFGSDLKPSEEKIFRGMGREKLETIEYAINEFERKNNV